MRVAHFPGKSYTLTFQPTFTPHHNMNPNSTESRLILALQAIKSNPDLSVRRAAQIYNVPRRTLVDRRAGKPSRRDIQPKSRKLTNSEESMIVQYIL